MTREEEFWRLVQRASTPDGCWLWAGPTNGRYGWFIYGGDRREKAHRVAYQLAVGPIPDGHDVDHVWLNGCRNKLCCRPDHLEAVTRGENLKRGHDARRPDREDVCIHGHRGQMRRKKSTGALECGQCVRERDRRRGSARGNGKPGVRGEKHHAAKLSDAQVEEIRRRVAAGEKQAALAREFGISAPYASQLVNHKNRRSG